MALFKRRSSPVDAVAPFWDWWSDEGRDLAERSIAGTLEPAELAAAMTPRVQALGDLSWELARGETSRHVLVVTAEGEPALRSVARRLVLAAPEADETWSYADSRPPVPEPEAVVLELEDGLALDLARVQVSARLEDGRFDVQVHHPLFAELSEELRTTVTYLALDATLGEVDTALWVGEVVPVEHEPLDGFGLSALRSVVGDLRSRRLDKDGQPQWQLLRGETSEGPLLAMVRSPLHPLLAPHLDTYVGIAVPYADRQADGLPGTAALDSLRVLEHRLSARLGNEGQVVGHLSVGGVRTFHLYVDSTAGLLPRIEEVARSWDQGRVTVHSMPDPSWQAVAHLRQ